MGRPGHPECPRGGKDLPVPCLPPAFPPGPAASAARRRQPHPRSSRLCRASAPSSPFLLLLLARRSIVRWEGRGRLSCRQQRGGVKAETGHGRGSDSTGTCRLQNLVPFRSQRAPAQKLYIYHVHTVMSVTAEVLAHKVTLHSIYTAPFMSQFLSTPINKSPCCSPRSECIKDYGSIKPTLMTRDKRMLVT